MTSANRRGVPDVRRNRARDRRFRGTRRPARPDYRRRTAGSEKYFRARAPLVRTCRASRTCPSARMPCYSRNNARCIAGRPASQRLNVSLDTLRADRFREITGNDGLDQGSERSPWRRRPRAFAPIKINMLALKGINDDEVEDMVDFCIEHGFSLRFIETMPVGTAGREASNHYIDLNEIRARLAKAYDLVPSCMPGGGPARYYRVNGSGIDGSDLHIGFITPMSQHFCDTCNRVRLSADGTLHLCLGQENAVPLRPLLRRGIDDDGLRQAIVEALALKPARHEFNERPNKSSALCPRLADKHNTVICGRSRTICHP